MREETGGDRARVSDYRMEGGVNRVGGLSHGRSTRRKSFLDEIRGERGGEKKKMSRRRK